jgi:hypothetical protein
VNVAEAREGWVRLIFQFCVATAPVGPLHSATQCKYECDFCRDSIYLEICSPGVYPS